VTLALSRQHEQRGIAATHRPLNIARTVFHVAAGALALVILRLVPSREWLIGAASVFATFCWTCEILRRRSAAANERLMRFFKPIAHANEWREVNSATWYATALLIMSIVVPFHAGEVGVVVLAIADPMAGFVGRRFGKHRLASGRSIEGSAAFAVTGATSPATGWGPPTQISGVTFFGQVRAETIEGRGGIFVHTLLARNDQKGCLKYSYFSGEGDRLPQWHACVFAPANLRFTEEAFGDPAYGQLAWTTDFGVRERGPGDDAMGAFGFLLEAHKWRNLQIRYREFMPVGVRPLLIPVT
jgi:dolichol kinase